MSVGFFWNCCCCFRFYIFVRSYGLCPNLWVGFVVVVVLGVFYCRCLNFEDLLSPFISPQPQMESLPFQLVHCTPEWCLFKVLVFALEHSQVSSHGFLSSQCSEPSGLRTVLKVAFRARLLIGADFTCCLSLGLWSLLFSSLLFPHRFCHLSSLGWALELAPPHPGVHFPT